LRIDRLVLRRGVGDAEGQWWVLDYKSTSQPQLQPELREQLLSYRAAVAQAQPGQAVRAAFLTAHGSLIELQVP
jgi:ATP-dependent helicase/nuclease subunit A